MLCACDDAGYELSVRRIQSCKDAAVPQKKDPETNKATALPTPSGSAESLEVYLESLLGHRVTVLSKLMNRVAGRFLSREFQLTVAEWSTLGQLAQHSPRTLRSLAEATFTDKAQMSRAAAALVERGYVRRRIDLADARSILFSITTKGKSVSEASTAARREADRRLLNLLSDEERDSLYSSLKKLTAYLLVETQAKARGTASGPLRK